MKKAFLIFMVLAFVVSVMLYDRKDEKFSSRLYIESVAGGINSVPSVQGYLQIWQGGEGGSEKLGAYFDGFKVEGDDIFTKIYNFLVSAVEYVNQFCYSIGIFFKRIWESINYYIKMFVSVFSLVPKFIPWNATVPV